MKEWKKIMSKQIKEGVQAYTPCRITECYEDKEGVIEVASFTGIVRLRGLGRLVWNLSNGKTSITNMVEDVFNSTSNGDKEELLQHIIKFIDKLHKRKLLVVNWDPIYKYEICQELYYE